MQLVVCEKPSVGAALAKALGVAERKNGYIEGDNIIVSWIVGINSTRLFSKMYNKKLNVGRVQTPTLAILLEREKSIADFKKEKYYTVKLKADGVEAVFEKICDRIRCFSCIP